VTIKRNVDGTFAKGNLTETSFKPGNVPWNKGMKGFEPSPETEFKPGQHVGAGHPSWKGGVQHIKNDVVHLWCGPNTRVRRSRKIYEEKFGPIPKGYIIFHKDGNMWNDDPDNLEAISRAELLKRNLENR
jgi:hypothetical protein